MEGYHIEYLQAEHMDQLPGVYAPAFVADPGWRWVWGSQCKNDSEVLALSGWFWERLLWLRLLHVPQHCFAIIAPDGKVCAVIVEWPNQFHRVEPPLLLQVKAGLLGMLWKMEAPLARLRRVGKLEEELSDLTQQSFPDQRSTLLRHVVVSVSHQKRGLGKALLKFVLDRCAVRGERCVLGTMNPRNVEYYRQAGFEVAQQRAVVQAEGKVPALWVYFMRHATSTPAAAQSLALSGNSRPAAVTTGDVILYSYPPALYRIARRAGLGGYSLLAGTLALAALSALLTVRRLLSVVF
jgi:GNAT superfamily N-acetyltransferase